MVQKSGALRRYHSWFSIGQRLLDATAVFILLPTLCVLKGIHYSQPYHVMAVLGALLTWVAMGAVDAYRPWRGAGLLQEMRVIFGAWLIVAGSLLFIAWMVKFTGTYSRMVVGGWFALSPLLLFLLHIAERIFLRFLRKRGRNIRTAVIAGAGDLGMDLGQRIMDADWMGIRLLGFFDNIGSRQGLRYKGVPVLGTLDELVAYVKKEHVDRVYLTLSMHAEDQLCSLAGALEDTTASVYMIPDIFVFDLLGARIQDMDGIPAISLCESPFFGPFGTLKRVEDMVLASLILLLVSPLMLAIAAGIKLTSPGPVIFKQRRYGLHGREVPVWKFRSMTVCEDGGHILQTGRFDTRVTRFGRFLRTTSLDELPQFINVLQGHMSVVGPRPHAVAHNEQYRKQIKGYMWRHKVKPGITGWAQVNGWRGETDTLDKMKTRVDYDLDYIRNWSPWMDIKIVWLTLFRGFTGKNAY